MAWKLDSEKQITDLHFTTETVNVDLFTKNNIRYYAAYYYSDSSTTSYRRLYINIHRVVGETDTSVATVYKVVSSTGSSSGTYTDADFGLTFTFKVYMVSTVTSRSEYIGKIGYIGPKEVIAKVQIGDETIMDVTNTTATQDKVSQGYYFYGADGARKVGTNTISSSVDYALGGSILGSINGDTTQRNLITEMKIGPDNNTSTNEVFPISSFNCPNMTKFDTSFSYVGRLTDATSLRTVNFSRNGTGVINITFSCPTSYSDSLHRFLPKTSSINSITYPQGIKLHIVGTNGAYSQGYTLPESMFYINDEYAYTFQGSVSASQTAASLYMLRINKYLRSDLTTVVDTVVVSSASSSATIDGIYMRCNSVNNFDIYPFGAP